ncbi:kinase domain protein (macronuclear) [Tetrahymena thermophila SB210]|uniref:Kinase domain protein n=1 Tax=Tetrahymena thermophila (strain SB210) TaxID=312017 RepID=Q23D22_TETTS|nr:kinase domain protein [Tetrahymena thermophila SB210]EAR94540.1 kinase domain protein [Tetrahymena thermophila SB210]|eukprot:XP_001014864.1 kinase domain protein [Tetrahymena thermophila SB210]
MNNLVPQKQQILKQNSPKDKQNQQFQDYLQNQNLYNPDYQNNQQQNNNRKSILKPSNYERNRSISSNNRTNSESKNLEKDKETIPIIGNNNANKSHTSLEQNQESKIKSFLSPNYYKYGLKAVQIPYKKEEQIEEGLRNIEKRRLERDKALIENYFNIPLILRTNKKILFEQEQKTILNQGSQGQEEQQDGLSAQQKQYILFKQNQETYKLNDALNRSIEYQNSKSKQEKQRFKLREQFNVNPNKQIQGSKYSNNINGSVVMSSISTSAGSKQLQNCNNNISKGRYASQQEPSHARSRSVKQYSYHQNSSQSHHKQKTDFLNMSYQLENNFQNPQSSNFFDSSILQTDINSCKKMTQKKIQFERSFDQNQQSGQRLSDEINTSSFLNASIAASLGKYGYTDAQPFLINTPTNLSKNNGNSSVITLTQAFSPIGEQKKGFVSNQKAYSSIMSNIIDGHSPEKLLYQEQQNIEFIPCIDQPPLILPIEESKPAETYQEIYVNEIGQPIQEEMSFIKKTQNKSANYRQNIQHNDQNILLKESFISNFEQKNSDMINEQNGLNNNSQINLSKQYQLNDSSITPYYQIKDVESQVSILKSSSLFLNKENYDILSNFSVKNLMNKGTHSEIYKLKNLITNKVQIAKRIQFNSKFAESAFLNEESIIQYFFDEGGSIKQQYQNHAGSYLLIQTTQIEKLQNEGIFIQQPGGKSLSRELLEIREETLKGEVIYHIYPTKLHKSLQNHKEQLYELIINLCEVIDLLSSNKIVHSDFRLENILVDTLDFGDSSAIQGLKIIDFGSSYFLNNRKGVSNIIPEYMPPEVLKQILGKQKVDVFSDECPWSVDIWTLGCIIIEIITGIPVWMPQRCLLHSHGVDPKKVTSGFFSHKQRRIDRIFEKQVKFSNQIEQFAKQYLNSTCPTVFKIDQNLYSIIIGIFKQDPKDRISPKQIINLLKNV